MGVTATNTIATELKGSKRKREDQLEELEVDLNAAQPPSKRALRKAKRSRASQTQSVQDQCLTDDTPLLEGKGDHNSMTYKGRSPYGIWIGNLPFSTTKDDLVNFLTSEADYPIARDDISRVHMPSGVLKNGKPQNKGYAYIDFTNQAALDQGLELSEKLLAGRRVLIKEAKNFDGRPANKEEALEGKPPSRRVFVGNLSFDTTSEALERHFGACGAIQRVQVATFEDSGKCKGYAWVEFEQLSSAQAAMRGWVEQGAGTNGRHSQRRVWLKKMDGRQLRMEYAEDATTRYNKRFGKESKKSKGPRQVDSYGDNQESITEVKEGPEAKYARTKRQGARSPSRRHGYEEETVKKLKGAIMEGQGMKVVFD